MTAYDEITTKVSKAISELESLRSQVKSAGHAISIETLLVEALEELNKVQHCAKSKEFITANAHFIRATQLIELVEIYDCGSVGGPAKGQLINTSRGLMYMDIYHKLFARFLWLYGKYIEHRVKELELIPSKIGANMSDYWKKEE